MRVKRLNLKEINLHALIGIDHIHLQMDDVESIEVTIGKRYVNFIEYKEMSFIKRVRRAFINS